MNTLTRTAGGLAAALLLAAALPAAAQPTGGPDAKGNAPLKHAHTVNDGTAKPGHTSFTRGQAQAHIEHSGYTNVQGLTKGDDGVWRGTAIKNGATVPVGMDFKGNVVEGAAAASGASMTTTTAASSAAMTPPAAADAGAMQGGAMAGGAMTPAAHATHHRRRHHRGCSLHPGPNGVACSGVDKNTNGVSDREDRATGK